MTKSASRDILAEKIFKVIRMKKKILSGLIIGAFIFGVGATSVQPVSAASSDNVKATKDKFDKVRDGDKSNRPEPPKDSNGKPIAPPNRGDKSNRPEPPKDSDGNPIAPTSDGDKSEQK